jgi:hypothetical protein
MYKNIFKFASAMFLGILLVTACNKEKKETGTAATGTAATGTAATGTAATGTAATETAATETAAGAQAEELSTISTTSTIENNNIS